MTQAQLDQKHHTIKAIAVVSDDDGKFHTSQVAGWSSAGEPDPAHRGLVVSVDDNIEVVIPFDQIRHFHNYMVANGF